MVIESLEINKLNNAISLTAKNNKNISNINDLKSMKTYYGNLTEFMIKKQNDSRLDEFENAFVLQTEEFLKFWSQLMSDFKKLSEEEIEKALEKNETLKNDLNEMLEKSLGFKAPPNSLFLNLIAIRKIAAKLKSNDATQFLNFDFYKKHNIKLNEDWIKERRMIIINRLDIFEEKLASGIGWLKDKLNQELWRLHSKRLKQFDKLMVKYTKVKNTVYETNGKEIIELNKMKNKFILHHSVPMYYHKSDFLLNGIQQSGRTASQPKEEKILEEVIDRTAEVLSKKSKNKKKSTLPEKKVTKKDTKDKKTFDPKNLTKHERQKSVHSICIDEFEVNTDPKKNRKSAEMKKNSKNLRLTQKFTQKVE